MGHTIPCELFASISFPSAFAATDAASPPLLLALPTLPPSSSLSSTFLYYFNILGAKILGDILPQRHFRSREWEKQV